VAPGLGEVGDDASVKTAPRKAINQSLPFINITQLGEWDLRGDVLGRGKVAQQAGDLADPVCAGDGVGGTAEDGGVVDVDGVGVDFVGEAGEVAGVVVEGLWDRMRVCISLSILVGCGGLCIRTTLVMVSWMLALSRRYWGMVYEAIVSVFYFGFSKVENKVCRYK
jgi:hypothetical protein